MSVFIYKALDANGEFRFGEMQAETRASAATNLTEQGLSPVSLTEKSGRRNRRRGSQSVLGSLLYGEHLRVIDKILLARHLALILKAGISLSEALDILYEDARKPFMKQLLREAREVIEQGGLLSGVFEQYPGQFSPAFIGLIKAGEISGNLDTALEKIATQLFRDYDLLKRVRLAMVYPLILLIGSAGVILLLLTFVLPRMAKAFKGVLVDLPLLTRFFINVSLVLGKNPLLTIAVFLASLGLLAYIFQSAWGKRILFLLFQRFPVSGDLIRKLALARLSRTLQNLLGGGMGAIEAFETVAKTLGNPTYQQSLLAINEDLKKGATLSLVFKERESLYPRLFSSIIMIGERTGNLEHSLNTLGNFYEDFELRNSLFPPKPCYHYKSRGSSQGKEEPRLLQ